MAKKRKAARARPGKAKASARKRPPQKSAGGQVDPTNVIAAVLVVVLLALGFYFYQANQKAANAPANPTAAVAVERK
jgi:hypothetical protein